MKPFIQAQREKIKTFEYVLEDETKHRNKLREQLTEARAQNTRLREALNECAKYSKLIGDRKSIVEGIVETTLAALDETNNEQQKGE